jgi:hypothetical protein
MGLKVSIIPELSQGLALEPLIYIGEYSQQERAKLINGELFKVGTASEPYTGKKARVKGECWPALIKDITDKCQRWQEHMRTKALEALMSSTLELETDPVTDYLVVENEYHRDYYERGFLADARIVLTPLFFEREGTMDIYNITPFDYMQCMSGRTTVAAAQQYKTVADYNRISRNFDYYQEFVAKIVIRKKDGFAVPTLICPLMNGEATLSGEQLSAIGLGKNFLYEGVEIPASNIEVKRELMAKYPASLLSLGAVEIGTETHNGEEVVLYQVPEIPLKEDTSESYSNGVTTKTISAAKIEACKMVRVVCPSTGRIYYHFVPQFITAPMQAVAWMFGLETGQYKPIIET